MPDRAVVEETMNTNQKIAEYGLPGDSFTISATPEGHIVLDLINTQKTRIAMTAHFAEMMAEDLRAALVKIDEQQKACGGYWVGNYNVCECDQCSPKEATHA